MAISRADGRSASFKQLKTGSHDEQFIVQLHSTVKQRTTLVPDSGL
jgi:hypothetical protein